MIIILMNIAFLSQHNHGRTYTETLSEIQVYVNELVFQKILLIKQSSPENYFVLSAIFGQYEMYIDEIRREKSIVMQNCVPLLPFYEELLSGLFCPISQLFMS